MLVHLRACYEHLLEATIGIGLYSKTNTYIANGFSFSLEVTTTMEVESHGMGHVLPNPLK
jgi:hypothetical protein